jgi:hypothetical protein
MQVKLPNGLLDGPDLFNVVVIGELTGKQQDYLVDRNLVANNIGHITKILEDMIVSFENDEGLQWKGDTKEAIWQLPSSDIITLLIKIRENTFGSRFYFDSKCPHCGTEHKDLKIELKDLKVTKYPLKKRLDEKSKTVTLPKSGKTVTLKAMYLGDMFKALKIGIEEESRLISSSIALAVAKIDDNEQVTAEDIRALPMLDLKFLQETLEKVKLEGDIDTTIENTCKNCKKDFEEELNVYDPDFFSLTRDSRVRLHKPRRRSPGRLLIFRSSL